MAAVELQRHAEGTAFVTLRSSEDEHRFKDIVMLLQTLIDGVARELSWEDRINAAATGSFFLLRQALPAASSTSRFSLR